MAILSNINDKFAVDSTGAIQFNGQVGTSGYVLKSNANAAPTWVDPSTIIGGPYLPLSGGTLTGNLAISGSNSLTVGGTLTGTSATFSGNVTIGTGIIKPNIGGDIAITQGAIGLRINDAASAISPTTATSNNDNAVDLGVSNIRFRNLYMGGTGTFGGNITAGDGTQAINTDADLTLRNGNSFVGIDLKSARTSGNIGGLRYYGTSSDTVPKAQFLVETDGQLQYYNGTNGAQTRLTINSSGNVGIGTTNIRAKLSFPNIVDTNGYDVTSIRLWDNASTIFYGLGVSASQFNLRAGSADDGFAFWAGESHRMQIESTSGNVGIGTNSPDQKLQVNGSIKIANSNSRLVFGTAGGTDRRALEGNTAGTLLQVGEGYSLTQIQSDTQVTGKTTTGEGIMVGGSSGYQIPVAYSIGNGNVTSGAIKIQLPQAMTNTMMMFKVRVYEYSTFEPFDITICGYNYQPNSTWYNVSAWIDSNANDDRNFTVRLGYDATATRAVAYIGELNAVWTYPQVWVTEWNGGHSNQGANWHYNYQISFETSAFTGITQTITNTQINNWARSGQNLYYGSGSGNVGIGTTSPSYKLDVNGTTRATSSYHQNVNFTNTPAFQIGTDAFSSGFFVYDSTAAQYRMVVKSSTGNVGIGNTSPQTTLHVGTTTTVTNQFTNQVAASNFFVNGNANGGASFFQCKTAAVNINMMGNNDFACNQFTFYHKPLSTSQNVVGTIATFSSSTQYNTTSDYRLKENIIPLSDSITRLKQLKPSRFNFIEDPERTMDGFLAHEVQNIVPEAVNGEKDAIDENGNEVHQGIDQAKLVPLLVAAIQELEARVKELENK